MPALETSLFRPQGKSHFAMVKRPKKS